MDDGLAARPAGTWKRRAVLAALGGVAFVVLAAVGAAFAVGTATEADRPVSEGLESVTYRAGDRTLHAVFATADVPPESPGVLFVHGSPGSWSAFESFLSDPALSGRARLASVDRPGFGGSGAGEPVPSLERQAAMLRPALERVAGDAGAILVGHSLGGAVVVRMAIDFPQHVAALVLVSASVDPDLERIRWYQEVVRWRLVRPIVPSALETANDEILPLRSELRRLAPRWREIHVPVVAIHGEDDRLVPVANVDYVNRRLSNAPLEIVRRRGLGHFVPWTAPGLVREAVLRVIGRIERAGTHDRTVNPQRADGTIGSAGGRP